jgi:two-component system chemotaxis response regulator CheB
MDLLVPVLQRWTGCPVKLAEMGEQLMEGMVYVAPADRHLQVMDSCQLELVDGRRISHTLSSADPMFRSAAEAFGPRLIAVVLTGTGRNGAAGVTTVHEHGGMVIAQDRETSAHFAMPAAAIATGAVDMVLPIGRIGPTLVQLLDHSRDAAAR